MLSHEELSGQIDEFVKTVNEGVAAGEHSGSSAFDWQLPDGRWLTYTRRPSRGLIERSRVRVVTDAEMKRLLE